MRERIKEGVSIREEYYSNKACNLLRILKYKVLVSTTFDLIITNK